MPYVDVHIPYGKKYCLWMTHSRTQHEPANKEVCYLMELDKHKQIFRVELVTSFLFPPMFSYGTLLYGCIPNNHMNSFVIEDIFYYKGLTMKLLCIGQKLGVIENFFQEMDVYLNYYHSYMNQYPSISMKNQFQNKYSMKIPLMCPYSALSTDINIPINEQVHHVEIWGLCGSHIKYHLCSFQCSICDFTVTPPYSPMSTGHTFQYPSPEKIQQSSNTKLHLLDTSSPKKQFQSAPSPNRYKEPTRYNNQNHTPRTYVFMVMADPQFDIYHLYAKRGNEPMPYSNKNQSQKEEDRLPAHLQDKYIYYNTVAVQTFKKSVYMNSLFRNIRENTNLDYIEESDEEDEFQDMDRMKYVNITKVIPMECVYNSHFRKWEF